MKLEGRPNWLDRAFQVGVLLKGLDGLLELVGGLLLLVITPGAINRVASALTQHELSEDPHDFFATHLLHAAGKLSTGSLRFGAVYLLLHGIAKVVLVGAVLRDKLWAYPALLVFLVVFIGYQLYRLTFAPSFGLVALTVFDAVIVGLTAREYLKQLRLTQTAGAKNDPDGSPPAPKPTLRSASAPRTCPSGPCATIAAGARPWQART